MAKFEIYNRNPAPKEKPIRLALRDIYDDGSVIELGVVDEDGVYVTGGNLLSISSDGMRLSISVSSTLGIPVTGGERKVVVVNP